MIGSALPTASTAVLFFHYHASIQRAMSQARDLLEQAKKVSGKHGLAVGYLRRSGATAVSIQPWAGQEGGSSASRFGLFAREHEPRLSPQLVADLECDAGELTGSRRSPRRCPARKPDCTRQNLLAWSGGTPTPGTAASVMRWGG